MSKSGTPDIVFTTVHKLVNLAEGRLQHAAGEERLELKRLVRDGSAAQHALVELCNAVRRERQMHNGCGPFSKGERLKTTRRANAAMRRVIGAPR